MWVMREFENLKGCIGKLAANQSDYGIWMGMQICEVNTISDKCQNFRPKPILDRISPTLYISKVDFTLKNQETAYIRITKVDYTIKTSMS